MDSTIEKLSVDSVSLSTYAWNVTNRSSRWKTPGTRGSNVVVPGRHGAIFVPDKKFEEHDLVLNMWALGCDEDGNIPSNMRDQIHDNLNTLVQLFTKRSGLIRLSQVLADGSTVEAYAEVTEAIDFGSMAGGTRAEFAVALNFPDPFWRDTSDVTYTSASNLTPGVQLAWSPFDGATAPMDDLTIVVSGPATNPEIVVVETGASLRYVGAIASGTDWRVNSGTWESVTGSGIGFAGAGTNRIANTVWEGSTRMLSIHPWRQSGTYVIEVNGSGFGANTKVQVRGRRKYLLG